VRALEPALRWAYGVDAATVIETWEYDQWVAHRDFLTDYLMKRGGTGVD